MRGLRLSEYFIMSDVFGTVTSNRISIILESLRNAMEI